MKVFVSFAQRDHKLVHTFCGVLIEKGITPLVAAQRLAPGSRLDDKIRDMIKESDCVVVLNTPNGSRSRWVQQEIGCAKALEKPIIPLKTRQARIAAMLQGYEYYLFKTVDPRDDFRRVSSFLRDFAEEKGIPLPKRSDREPSDWSLILHLPHAMLCPKCKKTEIHVGLCLICGDWLCIGCGETVPPSSRADAPFGRRRRPSLSK